MLQPQDTISNYAVIYPDFKAACGDDIFSDISDICNATGARLQTVFFIMPKVDSAFLKSFRGLFGMNLIQKSHVIISDTLYNTLVQKTVQRFIVVKGGKIVSNPIIKNYQTSKQLAGDSYKIKAFSYAKTRHYVHGNNLYQFFEESNIINVYSLNDMRLKRSIDMTSRLNELSHSMYYKDSIKRNPDKYYNMVRMNHRGSFNKNGFPEFGFISLHEYKQYMYLYAMWQCPFIQEEDTFYKNVPTLIVLDSAFQIKNYFVYTTAPLTGYAPYISWDNRLLEGEGDSIFCFNILPAINMHNSFHYVANFRLKNHRIYYSDTSGYPIHTSDLSMFPYARILQPYPAATQWNGKDLYYFYSIPYLYHNGKLLNENKIPKKPIKPFVQLLFQPQSKKYLLSVYYANNKICFELQNRKFRPVRKVYMDIGFDDFAYDPENNNLIFFENMNNITDELLITKIDLAKITSKLISKGKSN